MAKAALIQRRNVVLAHMRWFILIITTFQLQLGFAQDSSIYMLDQDDYLLGKISHQAVYTGPQEITFTIRGQSILAGGDAETGEAVFLFRGDDVFSRKAGLVYEKDAKTIRYITRKGGVFLGDHPIDEANERLLDFLPETAESYLVLHGLSGDTLGKVQGPGITAMELVVAAHIFIVAFDLDQAVLQHLEELAVANMQVVTGAIMYPLVYNGFTLQYEWDGRVLRKMLNGFPTGEWHYDGHRIQATMAIGGATEWTWEGGILKPSWDNDPAAQWGWNDNILKPYWDGNPDKMWILEDNIMRPMWNTDPNVQWVIEGDMPLPLIAMIALGIAR